MLEVKGLHKRFGSLEVLRGVDFRVQRGEVVAVLGSSGSGKTTLLRCISFLERADAGTITLGDFSKDITLVTAPEIRALRRKLAFVFQSYELFRNKTALQNVMEGLTVARKIPAAQARATAECMLQKVGMAAWADYYPEQLSGGQQQRVAIARAVALSPDVILFDEPTSALDPELTGEVLSVMRALAQEGTTMVVVTHEMDFAQNVANRVVFMDGGTIVEDAPSQEFFTHPKSERSQSFLRQTLHRVDYVI